MKIQTKRVYEQVAPEDGYRVLVDRLWPRGVRKADLVFDEWCKDIAPSTETRKAFGHKAENFEEFRGRYIVELEESAGARDFVERVRAAGPETLTLLYAAKDPEINHAVVLRDWLGTRL